MPLPIKLASIGSGAMGVNNDISDYYDGKKMDIVTMYGGPLGVLGVKAGVVNLLNSLKGKVSMLPGGMYK